MRGSAVRTHFLEHIRLRQTNTIMTRKPSNRSPRANEDPEAKERQQARDREAKKRRKPIVVRSLCHDSKDLGVRSFKKNVPGRSTAKLSFSVKPSLHPGKNDPQSTELALTKLRDSAFSSVLRPPRKVISETKFKLQNECTKTVATPYLFFQEFLPNVCVGGLRVLKHLQS